MADMVVNISSRNQTIRAIQVAPRRRRPSGAVILLAGGNGRLDITPEGVIQKLSGNQLVRTRELYARAGYLALVPDLAPDLKMGTDDVVSGYRGTQAYADDIGAMVRFLRPKLGQTGFSGIWEILSFWFRPRRPVVVIGTSRGSYGAANAVAKLSGSNRPNAMVLTSAFLAYSPPTLSVRVVADNDPGKLAIPSLVVWNEQDTCPDTLPAEIPNFRAWYEANGRTLALRSFSAPGEAGAPVCEANAPHGFWGIDQPVVTAITEWIPNALPLPEFSG